MRQNRAIRCPPSSLPTTTTTTTTTTIPTDTPHPPHPACTVAGKIGPPLRSGYAASKHASKGFFESVRADLAVADEGVTLTNVMLGSTNTALPRHALRGDGAPMLDAVVDENLRRGLAPERVASLALTAAANGVWEAWIARPGVEKHVGLYLSQYAPSFFRIVARSAAKRHAGRAVSKKTD